jgi:hypothetical protein
MKNTNLVDFPKKLSEILVSLDIQEESDDLIKKLSESYMLTFSRLMSSDEKISPYIKDFSSASDADPNKLLEYLDSKNVDYQSVLLSSQRETLQSFVAEIAPDLAPGKLGELNKIISE